METWSQLDPSAAPDLETCEAYGQSLLGESCGPIWSAPMIPHTCMGVQPVCAHGDGI